MGRPSDNKENATPSPNQRSITKYFKLKKCLFNSPKPMEVDSPKYRPPTKWQSAESLSTSPSQESPYSLFKVKKKFRITNEASGYDSITTTPNKSSVTASTENLEIIDTCSSALCIESENFMKVAVQKSIQNPNLIGDFSKPHILPVINGRHPDLNTIAPDTAAALLVHSEASKYVFIDCRYPYEFEAGHIKEAQNIYIKDDILAQLLDPSVMATQQEIQNVLIFYCEFSSERAPNMFRFLRNKDRELNKENYPFLHYPEMYLLEGGYKTFFENFKDHCEPQNYKAMLDKDHSKEMSIYRAKCKPLCRSSKRSKTFRSVLKF